MNKIKGPGLWSMSPPPNHNNFSRQNNTNVQSEGNFKNYIYGSMILAININGSIME